MINVQLGVCLFYFEAEFKVNVQQTDNAVLGIGLWRNI